MSQLIVKVIAKAKKNRVQQLSLTEYKVWTTAPAEDNKANQKVIELLAKFLNRKRNELFLASGVKNRTKIIEVTD